MKKFVSIILTMLLVLPMMAGVRSEEEAAALAADVLSQSLSANGPRRVVDKKEMRLAFRRMKNQGEEPALYAYNDATTGWAVISADDRTLDVLCYSDEGQIDEATMNPSLRWWLSRFVEEISSVTDQTAYAAPARVANATTVTGIAPLLGNIAYDQEAPYNNDCPMDEYNGKRCMTGCVATAAAMIMRYYKFPTQGVGSHSYTWEDCISYAGDDCQKSISKQLSVDFGATTYNWDLIRETYTSKSGTAAEKAEIAKLMYHCGVACEMGYASTASGAYTDDMAKGLKNYFGYTYTKVYDQYRDRTATTTVLIGVINADLEAKHPVLIGGVDTNDGGHEFVCDGRDTQNRFHINWGWNGASNCYTALTSLAPENTSYNFNKYLDLVAGLQPNDISETGVTMSPVSLTLDINATAALTATVSPANTPYTTVKWTSDDPTIASVDEDGKVRGVSHGVTTIRVTTTHLGLRASCTVTVTDKEVSYQYLTDTIVATDLAATTTGYIAFSGLNKPSGAVYAGKTARSADGAITIRTKNSDSGIFATVSPGVLESVKVVWGTGTVEERGIKVCGAAAPFASPADLFNATSAGSINYPATTCSLSAENSYMGLCAIGGVVYADKILITWRVPTTPTGVDAPLQLSPKGEGKVLRDGKVVIERGSNQYTILGQKIR